MYLNGFSQTGQGTTLSVSPTDIPGITQSMLTCIMGNQEGGFILGTATSNLRHAALWRGTATNSVIDINPTNLGGFGESQVSATNGVRQVGHATPFGGGLFHGILWSGTANSAIDLTPAGWAGSTAYGISPDGSQQAGSVTQGFTQTGTTPSHAAIFSGSAASFVDINPTNLIGFSGSLLFPPMASSKLVSASPLPIHSIIQWPGPARRAAQSISLPSCPTVSIPATRTALIHGETSQAWAPSGYTGSFNGSLTEHAIVWYAGDVWTGTIGGHLVNREFLVLRRPHCRQRC